MLLRPLLLLLLALTAARAEVVHVRIGGVTLRIPTPEGFLRYDGKSDKIDDMQTSFLPPSHRIVAAFGEPGDLQNVLTGKFPHLSRSLNAQENWQFENDALPPEEFAAVKTALREQMGSAKSAAGWPIAEVEKSASSALSAELEVNMKVKVGETLPLGVFEETPESICFALLVKSHLTGGPLQDPIDPVTAVAGCVMLARDRLLYLYANSSYDAKSDAEWTRQQIVAWRDAVLAANAPGTPEGSDLPPEPMAEDGDGWRRKKPWLLVSAAVLVAGWWLARRRAG